MLSKKEIEDLQDNLIGLSPGVVLIISIASLFVVLSVPLGIVGLGFWTVYLIAKGFHVL